MIYDFKTRYDVKADRGGYQPVGLVWNLCLSQEPLETPWDNEEFVTKINDILFTCTGSRSNPTEITGLSTGREQVLQMTKAIARTILEAWNIRNTKDPWLKKDFNTTKCVKLIFLNRNWVKHEVMVWNL